MVLTEAAERGELMIDVAHPYLERCVAPIHNYQGDRGLQVLKCI